MYFEEEADERKIPLIWVIWLHKWQTESYKKSLIALYKNIRQVARITKPSFKRYSLILSNGKLILSLDTNVFCQANIAGYKYSNFSMMEPLCYSVVEIHKANSEKNHVAVNPTAVSREPSTRNVSSLTIYLSENEDEKGKTKMITRKVYWFFFLRSFGYNWASEIFLLHHQLHQLLGWLLVQISPFIFSLQSFYTHIRRLHVKKKI